MLVCECDLVGASDFVFGAPVSEPKLDDETHEAYEHRTWPKKVRMDDKGNAFIQPFALKNALESSAKWLGKKIPGEGKKNYTARFRQGIMVADRLMLINGDGGPVTIEKIDGRPMFVPSTGVRGAGKRVERVFPTIDKWATKAKIFIFDNKITPDLMESHLKAAGRFIGFGSMRVENGGINGRFAVENFESYEMSDE
jgi:hypothetical protein